MLAACCLACSFVFIIRCERTKVPTFCLHYSMSADLIAYCYKHHNNVRRYFMLSISVDLSWVDVLRIIIYKTIVYRIFDKFAYSVSWQQFAECWTVNSVCFLAFIFWLWYACYSKYPFNVAFTAVFCTFIASVNELPQISNIFELLIVFSWMHFLLRYFIFWSTHQHMPFNFNKFRRKDFI